MNIDELLLDESVRSRIRKRREKEISKQGSEVDIVDPYNFKNPSSVKDSTDRAGETWKNNKNMRRTVSRLAKAQNKINKKLTQEDKDRLKTHGGIVSGQAIPSKDHINRYAINRQIKDTGAADHEKGHAKQWERIYVHRGSKGVAKALESEAKANIDTVKAVAKNRNRYRLAHDISKTQYASSPMEHNANHYAQDGDSKRVKKEREDIAKAYTKGRNAVEKLRNKNIKQSGLSKEEYGKKTMADEENLLKSKSKYQHESTFLNIDFK